MAVILRVFHLFLLVIRALIFSFGGPSLVNQFGHYEDLPDARSIRQRARTRDARNCATTKACTIPRWTIFAARDWAQKLKEKRWRTD